MLIELTDLTKATDRIFEAINDYNIYKMDNDAQYIIMSVSLYYSLSTKYKVNFFEELGSINRPPKLFGLPIIRTNDIIGNIVMIA